MLSAADQQIFPDRRGNRYGAKACYEPLEYKKDLESEQTFCGAFADLLRPPPTSSESKIRILVLTGMRGRVGGDMTVRGAHLCHQLILGATATGAVTTIVPRADPVFGKGSAKVGKGRRRWVPKPLKRRFPSHRAGTAWPLAIPISDCPHCMDYRLKEWFLTVSK